MEYREPRAIKREDAAEAFASADVGRINDALIGLVYHDPDGRWVQDQCLALLDYPDNDVRGLAVTCLGHIARIHRDLDRDRVLPALEGLRDDPTIGGRAQDALDDIAIYLGGR
jgi:hypothetical protein